MKLVLSELRVEGSKHEISLSKLTGQRIVDIGGYVSDKFGSDTLVFEVMTVKLEDGTDIWLEGEHDVVYIPQGNHYPNLDDDTLTDLYNQQQGE